MSNLYRGPSIEASYQVSGLGSFRGEDLKKKDEWETRNAYGGHVCYWIDPKWAIFIEDLP